MTREEALAIVRRIEGIAATSRRDDGRAQDDIRYLVEQLLDAPGARDVVREKVNPTLVPRPSKARSERPPRERSA